MSSRIVTVALVAAALAACRRPDAALSRAVRDYDDALVHAFAASDASGMAAVAGREEAVRVRVLVDMKTSARLVLESRLESFEVTSAVVEGEAGTVVTRERWRYHDRPQAPDARPGREIAARMVMRYRLARDGGRWKVESVSTVSSAPDAPTPP